MKKEKRVEKWISLGALSLVASLQERSRQVWQGGAKSSKGAVTERKAKSLKKDKYADQCGRI